MASPPAEYRSESTGSPDQTVRMSLDTIEVLLGGRAGPISDPSYFEQLGAELRRLHARVRSQHSAARVSKADDQILPEYAEEFERLQDEHIVILGLIDRVVRTAESIADRPGEDREVFFLRIREMIATLRRHEAEEDRLLCLGIWHDTGGES